MIPPPKAETIVATVCGVSAIDGAIETFDGLLEGAFVDGKPEGDQVGDEDPFQQHITPPQDPSV